MSNPGAYADNVPEPTLIEQDGAIPETVDPNPEPKEAPAEEPDSTEGEKPAAEAAQDPSQPKKKPWWQDRIDEQTRKRREAERRVQELEAKLQPAQETPAAEFKPEQFEDIIEQRAEVKAEQKLAQREAQKRLTGWIETGNREFGTETFTEKCNLVAAMGAGDSREFLQLVTDPDVIPDGHKVVAALADHPEEAQRILALPPTQMAAALTRFGLTHTGKAPEVAISKAPAPIKPVGGTAKSSTPDDADDIKSWMAKRNETARTTAGGYRRG